LNKTYDASARAFRVEEVAGGYQLRTRPQFSRWIRRMVGAPPEVRMSGPSLETLAVVAYRQPVLRTEVEAIRGVQCGEILRQLMERGMVRIAGRANELGRPFLYGTTRNFLQVFGLRSLDELPRASMLRKSEADQNEQSLNRQLEETDQDEYQDDDEDKADEEEEDDEFEEEEDDDSDEDDIDKDDEE
jgi:segregation and condensation protein B